MCNHSKLLGMEVCGQDHLHLVGDSVLFLLSSKLLTVTREKISPFLLHLLPEGCMAVNLASLPLKEKGKSILAKGFGTESIFKTASGMKS